MSVVTALPSNYNTVTCKFWKIGTCKFGKNCTFAHTDKISSSSCIFFLNGNCKYGTLCRLPHVKENTTTAKIANNNNTSTKVVNSKSIYVKNRCKSDVIASSTVTNDISYATILKPKPEENLESDSSQEKITLQFSNLELQSNNDLNNFTVEEESIHSKHFNYLEENIINFHFQQQTHFVDCELNKNYNDNIYFNENSEKFNNMSDLNNATFLNDSMNFSDLHTINNMPSFNTIQNITEENICENQSIQNNNENQKNNSLLNGLPNLKSGEFINYPQKSRWNPWNNNFNPLASLN